jgi:hypothetical protein
MELLIGLGVGAIVPLLVYLAFRSSLRRTEQRANDSASRVEGLRNTFIPGPSGAARAKPATEEFRCPTCQHPVERSATYCRSCGTALPREPFPRAGRSA